MSLKQSRAKGSLLAWLTLVVVRVSGAVVFFMLSIAGSAPSLISLRGKAKTFLRSPADRSQLHSRPLTGKARPIFELARSERAWASPSPYASPTLSGLRVLAATCSTSNEHRIGIMSRAELAAPIDLVPGPWRCAPRMRSELISVGCAGGRLGYGARRALWAR